MRSNAVANNVDGVRGRRGGDSGGAGHKTLCGSWCACIPPIAFISPFPFLTGWACWSNRAGDRAFDDLGVAIDNPFPGNFQLFVLICDIAYRIRIRQASFIQHEVVNHRLLKIRQKLGYFIRVDTGKSSCNQNCGRDNLGKQGDMRASWRIRKNLFR